MESEQIVEEDLIGCILLVAQECNKLKRKIEQIESENNLSRQMAEVEGMLVYNLYKFIGDIRDQIKKIEIQIKKIHGEAHQYPDVLRMEMGRLQLELAGIQEQINTFEGAVSDKDLPSENQMDEQLLKEMGSHALFDEATKGNIKLIEDYLQNGLEINQAIDRGSNTLLHAAVWGSQTNLVKMLLEKGADVDSATYYRNRPLHIAIIQQQFDIIKLLVQNNADVNARNARGHTPLHTAAMGGGNELIEYLQSHGAHNNLVD